MTKEFKPATYHCSKCTSEIASSYSGEFVSCTCGDSFVDQTTHYIRLGGSAVFGPYVPPSAHRAKRVSVMGSDLTIVNAARVSYDQATTELTEKDIKLINYLAEHQHLTPFEHATATFEINCSMPIAMQIMRHRTFSYNQVSRRYTSEKLSFFHPEVFRKQGDPTTGNKQSSHGEVDDDEEVFEAYQYAVAVACDAYQELLAQGVCREQARLVLPQALCTKFWMTGNLRNWAHFLKLRLDGHAQQEVQEVARDIYQSLARIFPNSIKALISDVDSLNLPEEE